MNKVLKGLVAVAATAAMAVAGFAGASTATAVEGETATAVKTSYTISFPTDAKYQGHTYEVYQIFTGDFDGKVLSNVKYGENGTKTEGTEVTAEELKQLTDVNVEGKTDQEKLDVIKTFAKLEKPVATLTKTDTSYEAAPGYYLIKDKDGSVSGNDASTLYITKVVGDVTISPKSDVPSFEKKVKDTNDTTGDTSGWQDSADYDVNDKVPFKLTATLPANKDDFAAYKTYKLVFTDNQSAGLTYPEASGFTVKYGGTVIPSTQYTLALNPTTTTADSTFTLTINDVKSLTDSEGQAIAVAEGGKFTVEYASTLNKNAVIGSAGNPNEAKLDYSNNPNYTGDGAGSPTGETPKDKVIVFTYQLNVNKTFDQGDPAESDMPKFTLYKKYKNGESEEWNKVGEEIALTRGGTEGHFTYTGSFSRIDDGEYKLVETHTPAGYNTAADTLFTITADHDVLSDNPALTSLKINNSEDSSNRADGTVQVDVVNKKGSNLPSTGGMGTVLLYVAGIAVFVLAGATLVMALRRRNA